MRFSGESIFLKLRARNGGLPSLVPESDGLVMEKEQNIVAVVQGGERRASRRCRERGAELSLGNGRSRNNMIRVWVGDSAPRLEPVIELLVSRRRRRVRLR